jgi:cell division septation protein DedD
MAKTPPNSPYAPAAKAPPDSAYSPAPNTLSERGARIKVTGPSFTPEAEWANDTYREIIDLPDPYRRPAPPPAAFDKKPLVVPLDFALEPAEERPHKPAIPKYIEPIVTYDDARDIDESLVVGALNGEIKKPITDPGNVIDESLVVEPVNEGIDETLVVGPVNEGIDESLVIGSIDEEIDESLITDSIIEGIIEPLIAGSVIEGIIEPLIADSSFEDIIEPLIADLSFEDIIEPLVADLSFEDIIEPLAAESVIKNVIEPPVADSATKGINKGIDESLVIAPISHSESPAAAPAEPEAVFSAPLIASLEQGKYYVQLRAFNRAELVNDELSKIGKAYPVAIQNGGSGEKPMYRILLGPLSSGESGALLQRFKNSGYPDAFVRRN